MRRRVSICAALASCTIGLGALGAPFASASHGQTELFEATTELLNPHERAQALAKMEHLGVKAMRLELYWSDVAPGARSARRPSFNATSPASYNWGQYEVVLAEAARLHWPVLLTVTGPAPRWASANHRAPYDTSPNDRDFQEFMTAVGKRFNSQVWLYAIWNEPNDAAFLLPQFNAKGRPVSPEIYRRLFLAGYAGLQAAGISKPKVLMGETSPVGNDTVEPRKGLLHDVAPLAFLREALCLNSRYQKVGKCGEIPAYGYSHHAYPEPAGPFHVPPNPDNVTIGVLGRLEKALDLAARAGAIRAGMGIYITEFGIQSLPNRLLGVPVAKQAEYDAISERIAYEDPRVVAFSQYLLRDDRLGGPPGSGVHGGFVGFQSGLEYINGRPKPLYFSFPVPLVVTKLRHGFSLWGLVRPANGATSATILVQRARSKRFQVLETVHTDSRGYWSASSSTQGVAWRVRWTSPTGAKYEGPPIRAYPPS